MATETQNLKLKKPGEADFYSIADFNDNWDKIDSSVAVLDPETGQVKEELVPVTPVDEQLAAAALKESPVDADTLALADSADGGKLKRVLWSAVKAFFAPSAHASAHGSGGADPITPAAIGARPDTWAPSWNDVEGKPQSYPPSAHSQAASTITQGVLGGKVQANASAAASVGTAQVRDIQASTTDLTAGSSSLASGAIYLVYE